MVDFKAALDFATQLGDVSRIDQVAPVVLRGLAELVPADLWAFNDVDEVNQDMVAIVWPPDGARPEDFEAVAKVVWEHPALSYFEQTRRGGPIRLSDLWDSTRYHASSLYRDAPEGCVGADRQHLVPVQRRRSRLRLPLL